jgi:hypothetical protein
MNRANLKELIEMLRPNPIKADMYADPLMRSMERIRERARKRYHDDLLALYTDRTLTVDQRSKGFDKASARNDAALKKLRPLEDRFETEVMIPMMVRSGVLRSAPPKSGKRRG